MQDGRSVVELSLTDEMRALEDESHAIRIAALDVISTWAKVELELCLLLADLIDDELGTKASIVFYTLTNSSTRLSIIGRLIDTLNSNKIIIKYFRSIEKKVKKLGEVRNLIAHGQIIKSFGPGGMSVRTNGPLFDLYKRSKEPAQAGIDRDELTRTITASSMFIEQIKAFRTIMFEGRIIK
jgi:hypothetical protein